jgi:predicted secreted protein
VRRSEREQLEQRLQDARGKRVIFVAHCVLNQNTRYLGGAYRSGCVDEIVDALQRDGIGICQLPCPEQRAWGGVLKPYTLAMYGSRGTLRYRARRLLLPLFIAYTRWRYWRLAGAVAREIADYARSGITVAGVLGIAGSPSCGVDVTLDLGRSMEVLAGCPIASLNREMLNEQAIVGCRVVGEGLFIAALRRQLRRRGLTVPFWEHDPLTERDGQKVAPLPMTGYTRTLSKE